MVVMMIFIFVAGVLRPLAKLHKHKAHMTYPVYAPTEALMKEFWLYPAIILRLFMVVAILGHINLYL